jgi:hypothetical protein
MYWGVLRVLVGLPFFGGDGGLPAHAGRRKADRVGNEKFFANDAK